MKVVLIEDEAPTLRLLQSTLKRVAPEVVVVQSFDEVEAAANWFKDHPYACDLAFMDIRLSDGLSLEIFSRARVEVPVVFVTAYDEYALEAFNTNGIAYLLKPVDDEQVAMAISKFKRLTAGGTEMMLGYRRQMESLLQQLQPERQYRQSFLLYHRDKMVPVKTAQLAWIHTENELCKARSRDGHTYVMEGSLEKIMEQLNPDDFYRVNRQYIVNRNAIEELQFYFNGRLSLVLSPPAVERVLVSKARASDLKHWLNH
ncbi:MAG: DNA-binding response regulator [Owenweeksia sp.]|nr:DNA-binding response regulator [Owenweeksia sp.]MBF99365.1 DNA-binding response regulator [Owenweeksia sp.]HBF21340.1 DNA-binding response regulator [Cryomorphaceae bacterium]|tara:strand:+ start:1298 stop:2071 length:774 start_codon:yes stop_codon:yes gene_type:complete